jgi:hypothetical protein
VTCPYGFNGTAATERDANGVHWTVAEPEVHATDEVAVWPLVTEKYVAVGPCPYWPGVQHMRLIEG